MVCHRQIAIAALLSLKAGTAFSVAQPWATSAQITLDIESGTRESMGVETATYDSTWYEGSGISYKITVNDEEIAQRSGCGDVGWSTRRPGVYVFKEYVYNNGVLTGEPLTATFNVVGRDLVNAEVSFAEEQMLCDGTPLMPQPQVKLGDVILVEGVDYSLSYENNVEPGIGKVVISGLGEYHDEIERTFSIVPAGKCILDIERGVREATGTEHLAYDGIWLGDASAESRVFVNGKQMVAKTGTGIVDWFPVAAGDYSLEYKTYVNGVEQAETYTAQFHVAQNNAPLTVELGADRFLFVDGEVTPHVTVYYLGKELTEGEDYTIDYRDNDKAGVAKVIVTGIGAYSGVSEKTFRIMPSAAFALDLNDGIRIADSAMVERIAYENTWSGTAASLVKVSVNDTPVVDNGMKGTYEWMPSGVGMFTFRHATYTGGELGETLTAQFYVPGTLAEADVSLDVEEYLYDGTERRPAVVVKVDGETMVEGLDYTLEYENNIAAGMAKVIVVGARGERLERMFTIRPAGVCFLSIESEVREAEPVEKLAYDTRWQGVGNADYRIWVDGAELAVGSGSGDVLWLPRAVGDHLLTYRAYVNGAKVGEDMTARFHVSGQDLVNATVLLTDTAILYDGTAKTPKVNIEYEGRTLVEGVDYELTYRDNVEAGTGVMTIVGKGTFVDVVEVPFTIVPAGVCFLDIQSGYRHAKADEILHYDYQWHGSADNDTRMQVRVNDAILGESTGIGGMEWLPTEGGQYVVKLRTYVNDYLMEECIETAYFGIPGGALENWDLTVTLEKNVYQYDGLPKTPKVTVKSVLGDLIEGSDFSVAYQNNVEVGTATVIVTGIGIYSGSFTRTFRIVESVSGAFQQVRQRYPWNGYVDIGVSIKGDSNKEYPTTFTAYDIVGGTNIPMNVVAVVGGTITNKTQSLAPGDYKLIWNADNDLPYEYVNTGVVIRASIEDYGVIPEGGAPSTVFQSEVASLDIQFYPVIFTENKVDLTSRNIAYGFESGKNWTQDTSNKKTGTFSYKSYKIGHSASTFLTATVKGKGTFSFWWKVSSESNYDWLRYYVNGTEKAKISGTKDWAQVTIPITSTGETVIKWTYSKDGSQSTGSDCGWIDATWTPTEVFRYDTITNIPPSWTSYVPKDQWIPTRKVTGKEQIVYSSKWNGEGDDDLTSVISVDGTVWKENIGEGVAEWMPDSLGAHILKHTIRGDNGVMGESLRAKFIVEELSEIVEDIPVLKNVVASQRYPWNGLVDVKCILEGDGARDYKVTLAMKDEMGGTNLPARTFWQNGGTVTNSAQIVRPGNLHFVWDANADIAEDGDFPAVSVTLKAESSAVPSYTGVVAIEENGYQGGETLRDVPVLVRLGSDTEGFSYSTMAFPETGADLRFMDWDEKNVLPYEIDEWHNGGESLVWVKVPELKKGTRFKMFYGGAAVSSMNETTHRMGYRGEAVWSDYAGVWHMNEDSGTAYDSTAHGLDALPSFGTNTNVDVASEMMAYEIGVCGRARQNEISEVNETKGCGNYLLTPSYDALGLGGRFIVSGWFRAEQVVNYPRMMSRKYESSDKSGWEIHPRQNSSTNISVRGATGGSVICPTPEMKEAWVNITAIYSDAVFSCFTNGVLSLTGESVAATDNGLGLAFGCNPPGNENTWCGQYDEIRLRGGSLSPDRIKADYDMIKNRDFLIYGPVKNGKGATE